MKKTICKTLPFIAGAACLASCSGEKTEQKRPNILFVFVDDLGHGDVGFNGSTYYETPNIDAMAAQSVVFQNSYTYPTSSPTRTALFTGQQSFRTGVYNVPALENGTAEENIFSKWTVTEDFPFYSEQLAKAGYKSIHIGKWHVCGPYPDEELAMDYPFSERLSQPDPGDYSWVARHKSDDIQGKYYPIGRGFETNVGGTYRGDPALVEGGYKSETGSYVAPFTNPFIEQKEGDEWLTDRLTDEAIDFMKKHKDEPFFINLHYYTVHAPVIQRSQELFEKYMAKEGDPVMGQGVGKTRKHMAAYATMIENLDDNFKRMIDFLKESGLDDNTIVVFSSDNGYNAGANNLLRGKKQQIYEGGVRVPTFVYWKGKITARRTDAPIFILDYYPTFLEMAGINDYKGTLDGNSIVPLLTKDEESFTNRPIFWQVSSRGKNTETCTAMRKGDYKAIEFLASGRLEVYDLVNDPKETTNLAETNVQLAESLRKDISAWRAENNIPLPPNAVVK